MDCHSGGGWLVVTCACVRVGEGFVGKELTGKTGSHLIGKNIDGSDLNWLGLQWGDGIRNVTLCK